MSSYCKVWINGQEIEADADRKLIDVLRNDCRLKSVKDGCSEGACGTCTVLVDGKATKACVQKMGAWRESTFLPWRGSASVRRMCMYTPSVRPERYSAVSVSPAW